MSRLRVRSLRSRVLAVAVGLLVAGMVAVNILIAFVLRSALLDQVDQQLQLVPDTTVGLLTQGRDALPTSGQLPQPELLNDLVVTRLDGKSGTIVDQMAGPRVEDAPRPNLSEIQTDVADGQPLETDLMTLGGVGDDHYAYRVRVLASGPGADVVVIAKSLSDVKDAVVRVAAVAATITVGLLGLLVALALPMMRRGLRPITDLATSAKQLGAGDLAVRAPHDDEPQEVGQLSRSFNDMAEQIEVSFAEQRQSEERLRRFVADASHELRTPLTSIRAYSELAVGQTDNLDPEIAQALLRIESESVRMSQLVDDLLMLARLDHQRPETRTPVNLAAVVEQLASDVAATARDHRVVCLPGVSHPAWVLGDEHELCMLVSNLLRNATVHTPAGTEVVVDVRVMEEGVQLSVADDGPGMSSVAAAHAFERFFRPAAGRVRGPAGSGLGLAIVEGVATAHRGTVRVDTGAGRGATFIVTLPRDLT